MADWRILITDGLEQNGMQALHRTAEVLDRTGISTAELSQIIPTYDALIVRSRTRVTAGLLRAAERLKVIGRAGVGVDNIDLDAAQEHSVTVVNAPTATTPAVAELTLALLLALAREIPRSDNSLKSGKWLKNEFMGIEIAGKRLGIIGMGHIGAAVAEKASALGMIVLGYDPFLDDAEIRQRGTEPVRLEDLCSSADFISLHVPLTEETRHLIDAPVLARMKPGVRLVCAARGGIVDEKALLSALDSGHVAGAALDVFETEPPGTSALVMHPHVIVTPHIGAQTAEAQQRVAQDIAEEVLAALNGKPLRWKLV